jgi:tetratricopeptide (TPR) repeat protein
MRVPLALIADHAIAHQTDGKLYVTGGGIRMLPFAEFPAVHPHLALALGIEVAADELGKNHALTIEASGPTDDNIFIPVRVTFSVPARPGTSEPGYIHVVSNMDNVSFPSEGDYVFSVSIDEVELAQLHLSAERRADVRAEAENAASREAESLVNAGLRAFAVGQIEAAEDAFRAAMAKFPTPTGHNNLGFVLLEKGDPRQAVEAFTRARELGYVQTEILDANLGIASYMSGEFDGALQLFEQCLRTRIFRSPAILFGISDSGLFPISVDSAADYAALITLNAGWSAAKAGHRGAADRYLNGAKAAAVASRHVDDATRFSAAARALDALLHAPPKRKNTAKA